MNQLDLDIQLMLEQLKIDETDQKEIDFIVKQFDKRIYIQSALRMDEEEKTNSELESLKITGDFF